MALVALQHADGPIVPTRNAGEIAEAQFEVVRGEVVVPDIDRSASGRLRTTIP
jgi:hypothetical protein